MLVPTSQNSHVNHWREMNIRQRKKGRAQVARFVAVGVLNTILGYSMFAALWLLLGEWWHPLAVLALSYCLTAAVTFYLHRRFVFYASNPISQSASRYIAISLTSIGMNFVLLQVLSAFWGVEVLLAQAISLLLAAVFSFFAHKFWTFKS